MYGKSCLMSKASRRPFWKPHFFSYNFTRPEITYQSVVTDQEGRDKQRFIEAIFIGWDLGRVFGFPGYVGIATRTREAKRMGDGVLAGVCCKQLGEGVLCGGRRRYGRSGCRAPARYSQDPSSTTMQ